MPSFVGFLIVVLVVGAFALGGSVIRLKVKNLRQRLAHYKDTVGSYSRQLEEIEQKRDDIQHWIDTLSKQKVFEETLLTELKQNVEKLKEEYTDRKHQIDIDITRELEQKRAAYLRELETEFANLKKDSEWQKLEKELREMTDLVELGKKTLVVVEQKVLDEVSKEDFTEAHSIQFSENDKDDIRVLTTLTNDLHNKEAIQKLIWTCYYQKPLQVLRKELKADKVSGIYRITNVENQRCYIGTSTDIGNRWTEHLKLALGVSGMVVTDKFHRALKKHGPEAFTYEILEECAKNVLREREQYWIEFYDSIELGYNSVVGNYAKTTGG